MLSTNLLQIVGEPILHSKVIFKILTSPDDTCEDYIYKHEWVKEIESIMTPTEEVVRLIDT